MPSILITGDSITDVPPADSGSAEVGSIEGMSPFSGPPYTAEDIEAALAMAGSGREAARLLGINHETFGQAARALGLPLSREGKGSVATEDEWAQMQTRWNLGESADSLHNDFPNASPGTIRTYAERHDWSPHSPGRQKKK
jgi:hypothetical protein